MKRLSSGLAVLLVILLIFAAGCGNSSNSTETYYSEDNGVYTEEAVETKSFSADSADFDYSEAESASGSVSISSAAALQKENVKIIYTADISIETLNFDTTTATLQQLADEFGGYVSYSDIYQGGYDSGSNYKSAYFTLRIPTEEYEEFLNTMGENEAFHVTSLSQSAEDVGSQYYDIESRIETLKIEQERLQDLMKEATEMEDIIQLESALSDVEYEIENYTSELNRYDSLIDFSTVNIDVTQVTRISENTEAVSFSERIANAFRSGVSSFSDFLERFAVWFAASLFPILLIAVIVIVLIIIIRKSSKRRFRRKLERETALREAREGRNVNESSISEEASTSDENESK